MRVGLTYDLRDDYLQAGYDEEETAEFDREDTIDGLEGALKSLGFKTDRIGNARSLVERLSTGQKWDLVFNICEGLAGFGRESQLPAILEAYRIPYTFSDPTVLAISMHKAITKRVLRGAGITTPPFVEIRSMSDIPRCEWTFPLFAKPVAEGTGKGVNSTSKVDTYEQLLVVCERLLERFQQPVIVEKYLPGREFTVGIVGTGLQASCLGVMEVLLKEGAEPHGYSYFNKAHYEKVVEYQLVDGDLAARCSTLALKSWQVLGCRDGGRIDLRLDDEGQPNLVEVNPLAGLNPNHSDLPIMCQLQQIPYSHLIEAIMKSALTRLPSARVAC